MLRPVKGKVQRIYQVARRLLDEEGYDGAKSEARKWQARFVTLENAEEEESWKHILLAIERMHADEQDAKG